MNTWKVELLQRAEAFTHRDTKDPSSPVFCLVSVKEKRQNEKNNNLIPQALCVTPSQNLPSLSSIHSFIHSFVHSYLHSLLAFVEIWIPLAIIQSVAIQDSWTWFFFYDASYTHQLFGSFPQWVFRYACKFLHFKFKAKETWCTCRDQGQCEVAVDTMFATMLKTFTFCY